MIMDMYIHTSTVITYYRVIPMNINKLAICNCEVQVLSCSEDTGIMSGRAGCN